MFASLLLAASVGLKVVVPSFVTSGVPDFIGHRMSQLVAQRIETLGCATAMSIDDVPAAMRVNFSACSGQASCLVTVASMLSASHVVVGYVWSKGLHYSVRMLVLDVAKRRLVKSLVADVPAKLTELPGVAAREGQPICDSLYSGADLPLAALPPPSPPAAPATPRFGLPPPPVPEAPPRPSTALGMSGNGNPAAAPPIEAGRASRRLQAPSPTSQPAVASTALARPLPSLTPRQPTRAAHPERSRGTSGGARAAAGGEGNRPRPSLPPSTLVASSSQPAPGHSPVRLQVAQASGTRGWLHLPVTPRARMWTWVGLGTTGAALILGGSFGLSTLSAVSTRSAATTQADFYSAQSSLGTRATVANVAYGVTAVALAASAVLWFDGDHLFQGKP